MTHPAAFVATSFFLLSSGAAVLASSTAGSGPAIHISNGRLSMDGALVLEGFSLVRSEPGYLFFYVPAVGLITLSPAEFPGAREAGRFAAERVTFAIDGKSFVLEARGPVLAGAERPAWASLDAAFSLEVEAPMFGYGDDPTAPREWPRQIRHGQ